MPGDYPLTLQRGKIGEGGVLFGVRTCFIGQGNLRTDVRIRPGTGFGSGTPLFISGSLDASIVLANLVLDGAKLSRGVTGIRHVGLQNVTVQDCRGGSGAGGGISASSITAVNCTFSGNTAPVGGAVDVDGGAAVFVQVRQYAQLANIRVDTSRTQPVPWPSTLQVPPPPPPPLVLMVP